MTDLKDTIAVVAGSSQGLGRCVAMNLASRSAAVALVARSAHRLQEAEQEIKAAGGVAHAFPTDIASPEAVNRLKEQVERRIGVPGILVNAAGVFGPIQLVQDSDPEQWIETVKVNTLGPYLTCRAFVKGMIRQRWGRIINFSSAAAVHPPGPLNSAYATSKVALNQFTRQLAAELTGSGVTANLIHPGDVKTPMWGYIRDVAASLGPEGEGYRQWVQWVDETGGDPPQKAADLVLRLVSEESESITGQFLWIEEGLQTPIPSWSEAS